jgi:hypothetical protein
MHVFIDAEEKLQGFIDRAKAALAELEAHIKGETAPGPAVAPKVATVVTPSQQVTTITPAPGA